MADVDVDVEDDEVLLRRVIPAKEPRSGCHPLATAEANDISSSLSTFSLKLLLLGREVADKTSHRRFCTVDASRCDVSVEIEIGADGTNADENEAQLPVAAMRAVNAVTYFIMDVGGKMRFDAV